MVFALDISHLSRARSTMEAVSLTKLIRSSANEILESMAVCENTCRMHFLTVL